MRVLILLVLLALPVRADPPPAIACSDGQFGPRHCIRADRFAADTCAQIAAEAAQHSLPPGYLARLLWQESRFDPMARSRRISPLATPTPRFAPWGVQVGYGRTQAAAQAAWNRLAPACRAAAGPGGVEYVPLTQRGPGRPTIIATRIAAPDRVGAMSICRAVSDAGCICRAFRN
ncbi:hypothetical protein JSE7799_03045 [Jannaschia seosinensis]|uniref:Sporulation related domain protein n=1 Tax=Jannaschia seosinensis TaxID=313367 RepID=A0A0M7BEJ2_9RHOB|nr:hypothetical protein [Jannaschia seosinensis]CUH40313.1 hypothetical protein JSE7799_03045 [Jannaschia seosinensis]